MHAVPEADQGALGEKIAARLVELAAISDEPERLTRLYLGPAHRKAADRITVKADLAQHGSGRRA